MSIPINDGGPAFPRPGISSNWGEGHFAHTGMTLRDYFAGQALAGLWANPREDYSATTRGDKADESYRQADAMLASREAKP